MAARGAWAEVRSFNLDDCSASCSAPAIDDLSAAQDEPAGGVTLSLLGGTASADPSEAHSGLIFDPKAMPAVLVSGLPSPIASAGALESEGRSASPYDFFAGVIDVPRSDDARAFAAVSFALFTPSLTGRRALTDALWASQALFERPSGDVASRLALPLPGDGGWRPTATRAAPTPSLSQISGPPPGAPVWDEWSCVWTQPLSDPWKQPSTGPC
jgi:hypothetical protein